MGGDKNKGYGLAAAVLILVLAVTGGAWAQASPNVMASVTTGQAKIYKDNLPAAKKAAESNALAIAVQNAAAGLLPRQAVVQGLEFIYKSLVPNARDYVVTYQVLGGVELTDQYLAGVASSIDLDRVEKALSGAMVLTPGRDKPGLLLLIAEQVPGDLLPKYWWGHNPAPYRSVSEAALISAMNRNQFEIVGADPHRPDPGQYHIKFSSIYDEAAAMDLARAVKADVVVMGKADAQKAANRMGDEQAFDAAIRLDAWDIATGTKIGAVQASAAAKGESESQGTSQAISKAADIAAADLSKRLSEYWNQNSSKDNAFDVRIEGDQFLPRFIALKKRLGEIPEIERIRPKEIGAKLAVMEIGYKGSTAQFAETVMLKTFEGFGIEIVDVNDARVLIRFVNDPQSQAAAVVPPENTTGGITEKPLE